MTPVRVVLPATLRSLAGISGEAVIDVDVDGDGEVTTAAVLDALDRCYPVLRWTLREQQSGSRRPFIRFFACQEDLSLELLDAPLPAAVAAGREPLVVIGAIAGG